MFFAPDGEPFIDSDVQVLHITGLDDAIVARPLSKSVNITTLPADGSAINGYYWGNDFRSAYVPNVNLTGNGQTVGIVGLDTCHTIDLKNYASDSNIQQTSVSFVTVGSAPVAYDAELTLDIDMVNSMAPGHSSPVLYLTVLLLFLQF